MKARLLILLGALLLPSAAADAATYTVWSCKKPGGQPAATEGWSTGGTVPGAIDCPGGGPVRATLNGGASTTSSITFTAPSGSKIAGYVLYRSVAMPAGNYRFRHWEDAAVIDACDNCGRGDATRPLSEANAVVRGGLSLNTVAFSLECLNADPAAPCGDGATAAVHRAAFLLTDDTIPEFVATSGTLLDDTRSHSGTISASFSAKDTGSGVHQAIVEVDGTEAARQVVDANDGRCAEPFTSLKPCRPSASGSISLDTTRFANGRHDVKLIVTDATGENVAAVGPKLITIDNGNGGRGAPNGTGATEQAKITIGFRGRRGTSLTTSVGRRIVVEGRLTDTAGRAITNATVELAGVQRRLGATEQVLAQAATGPDGRWSTTVTASPGYRLVARYRAFTADQRFAATAEAALKVRASASFKLSRSTVRAPGTVRFTGALRGAAIPPGGKIVVLQVFQSGRWRTFRDLRTNRAGRVSYSYRFAVRRTLRLKWRLRIPKDASYPYESGFSKARSLRVRG